MVASSLVFPGGRAAAQGARQARAARAPRSADQSAGETAPATEASVQPARSVLHSLVGQWRFAIWFAGNFDGPPDASGTRTVEPLYDQLRVQWSDQHDDSSHSQGVIGFDPRTGRFYSSAVYSDAAGVELLSGTPSPAEPLITFSPVAPAEADRQGTSFTLTVVDQDHFMWAPLDHGWRAVFTREPDHERVVTR